MATSKKQMYMTSEADFFINTDINVNCTQYNNSFEFNFFDNFQHTEFFVHELNIEYQIRKIL